MIFGRKTQLSHAHKSFFNTLFFFFNSLNLFCNSLKIFFFYSFPLYYLFQEVEWKLNWGLHSNQQHNIYLSILHRYLMFHFLEKSPFPNKMVMYHPTAASRSILAGQASSWSVTETVNKSHKFVIKGYFLVEGHQWAIYFYPSDNLLGDNTTFVSVFVTHKKYVPRPKSTEKKFN